MSSEHLFIKDADIEDFKPLTKNERAALKHLHDMHQETGLRVETFGEEINIGRRQISFSEGTVMAVIGYHREEYFRVMESHDGRRWGT